jgi:prepilin-type N-terminal cleavage/methylation domain-containing protein
VRAHSSERGDSLIEVIVAVAIVAVVTGAISASTIAAAHRFGPDAVQTALESSVAREMRVAVDVMKYQGASIAPASLSTAIPLPSSSPVPATLTLSSTTARDGSVTIVLTATSRTDSTKSATLTETIAAPAPLPGARVPAASDGSAPQ